VREAVLAIYPTDDSLLDDLTEFTCARLPAIFGPIPDGPSSLDEDWWLEDRVAAGVHFPLKKLSQRDGLRACYRWARQRAWERGEYGEPSAHAQLLLHQMLVLQPTMFVMAKSISQFTPTGGGDA